MTNFQLQVSFVLGLLIIMSVAIYAYANREPESTVFQNTSWGVMADGHVNLKPTEYDTAQAQRFYDNESGIVCWVSSERTKTGDISGAISCVKP